jgi:hypothetical protein
MDLATPSPPRTVVLAADGAVAVAASSSVSLLAGATLLPNIDNFLMLSDNSLTLICHISLADDKSIK